MLQNIREIGMFMIVAQAVVHFAPGRQYEKYIKSISSVIILLLFLKPFVQFAGGTWQAPSAVLDRLQVYAELSKSPSFSSQMQENGVEDVLLRRMEEEIAARLNRELAGEDYLVKRVELSPEEGAESIGEASFFSVKVVMGEQSAESGEIAVGEITVGATQAKEEKALEAYRLRFAGLLGMEKEHVEVRWDG